MKVVFRARSILQLTIVGFLAVTALLIGALLVTARQIDRLSEESQATVTAAASAMRASRQLIEQTVAMERNARQYIVLGDESLWGVYRNRRTEFLDASDSLEQLEIEGDISIFAAALRQNEQAAFEQLSSIPEGTDRSTLEYPGISAMAYEIFDAVDIWIGEQLSMLEMRTEQAQQSQAIQSLLLVCCALLLVVLFIVLITRPMRQLDKAIHQLGAGAYSKPIRIVGPRDLRSLGVRLDWLRSRLEELEQQRTSFLRHVSHELKTPLASMQEGASLLDEGLVGQLNKEQKAIARIITSNCKRLLDLIEDLLRNNSQNFAVLNAQPEQVWVAGVVEEVIDAHQLAISNGHININKILEKAQIYGDRERLRVAFDNLFTNAIKFSPEGGVITIEVQIMDEEVVLTIADEGPGIPEQEKDKIFDAFFQGSAGSRDTYKGSGLGLAIAKEYILAGNGKISLLDSNRGACFQVTFPVYREEAS